MRLRLPVLTLTVRPCPSHQVFEETRGAICSKGSAYVNDHLIQIADGWLKQTRYDPEMAAHCRTRIQYCPFEISRRLRRTDTRMQGAFSSPA
jgi:hypothetical protein